MDNPQAFPVGYDGHDGMTIRDYFAGQALISDCHFGKIRGRGEDYYKWRANSCYQMADAILEARKEKNDSLRNNSQSS